MNKKISRRKFLIAAGLISGAAGIVAIGGKMNKIIFLPGGGFGTGMDGGTIPLTNSLKAYWKFDEASGNAADAVGANTLVNNAGITGVPGKIGNAAALASASSQYFSIANGADINVGNFDFTFAGWVQLTTFTGVRVYLWNSTTNKNGIQLFGIADEYLYLSSYDNTGQINTELKVHHAINGSRGFWAVRYKASEQKMYLTINTTTASEALIRPLSANTGDTTFGSKAAQYFMNGELDEWGKWNRFLRDADLLNLYNGGVGKTYPFDPLWGIVFEGDSLTFGNGMTAYNTYPFQTITALHLAQTRGYVWSNQGENGQTVVTMLTQIAGQIAPKINYGFGRNIAVICAGVNDLRVGTNSVIATPQETHDNLATWVSIVKILGYLVILQTITPSTYAGDAADINTRIDQLNSLIRADKCGADYVADVAVDARMTDSTNETYYSDGLHNTIAGYGVRAELTSNIIKTL